MKRPRRAVRVVLLTTVTAASAAVVACDQRSSDAPAATAKPQRRVADAPVKDDPEGEVVEQFKRHRAAFVELKDMMLADAAIGEVTLADLAAGKPSELAAVRRDAYGRLLSEVGASSVASRGDGLNKGEVAIAIPAPAGWPSGARATIVFAEAIGLQRVETLADRLASGKGLKVARELDIDWYLVGRN